MQRLWLRWGCGGERTLPLSLRIVCLRAGSLIVPTMQSPVMGTHKRRASWTAGLQCQAPEVQTWWPHFHSSRYGALQELLQQTYFYDSDTVRACVTHVFLFALSHFPGTHTHRCSVFCFCSEAVLICVSLHCLLVFYLIAALAVWLGLASLTFLTLQLWAPDWVRYGSINKQS